MKTILRAQWLATMAGPLVRDGGVVFDERQILGAGVADALREEHPDAINDDVGQCIILPGLVNPHTHLELSDCQPMPLPPGGFAGWLKELILRTGVDPETMRQKVAAAIDEGVRQCLRFGVTSVGDISKQAHLTRPLLAASPLRVVSYGEVQAMAMRRDLLEERLAAAVDFTPGENLRIGLSPHAAYSIEQQGYAKCLEVARERNLPLATHLAESADEAIFLSDHAGPFRELWDGLGWWDEQVPKFSGGPIRLARFLGLLDYPTLLAHVNYCDEEELAILAAGKASVVFCPRTHAYFCHPPHRWRSMLQNGVNIALGTDSCASSPDLNLVDELRLVHRQAPQMPPLLIWEMGTIRAARAICQERKVGSIVAGKCADFAIFPIKSSLPLVEILEESTLPSQVWIGGKRVGISSPVYARAMVARIFSWTWRGRGTMRQFPMGRWSSCGMMAMLPMRQICSFTVASRSVRHRRSGQSKTSTLNTPESARIRRSVRM